MPNLWQAPAKLITRGVEIVRSSLSLRAAVSITLVGLLVLTLFSIFVTARLTNAVFENRRSVILEDAAIRYSQAHAALDQATASSPDQVQELARQVVSNIQSSAATNGAVAVILLRSTPETGTLRINEIIPQHAQHLITDNLRNAVQGSHQAQWQSIALDGKKQDHTWLPPWGSNESIPAIATGATVSLPRAGAHELYIVYSLENEQNTVKMTMNVLLLGAIPLLIIVPFAVFWAIYRLLAPVHQTARAATSLASGNLDVRVPVSGSDEMAQLGNAFNDMALSMQNQITEYGELATLQQRFVSDVSHELRTPLTTIRMAEEMIWDERNELSPAGKRSAELLHGQVERFESMLADLLEISRLDAQSAQLEAENTDLRPLVTKVVDNNSELAQRQNVTINIHEPRERVTVEIDARRIERVLRNLIVNAIEHAEGQPIDITLAMDTSTVAVRVRDYGVGMTEETASRVFDRFFRADPARARTTGGTGLGLAIAHEDVSLHGGQLRVYGELGHGSSFLLLLPKRLDDCVTDEDAGPLQLWEEA